jgi:hypothetical protein
MAANQALISTKQGENQRLWSALEAVLRKFALRTDNCLPAQVIDYDRAQNTATVKPMIMVVRVDGTTMSRDPIAEVPVIALGGGGFVVNFPMKQGDLGWIFAADRDLSLFLQALGEQAPNSTRAHRFDDSIFVPDKFRQYVIDQEDDDAMVIQTLDNSTKIAIHQNGDVKIKSPTKLTVEAPNAEFTGNVKIDQNLEVGGTGKVDGSSLTVNGVEVYNHDHQYVPGTGTPTKTGPMQD